MCVYVVGLCRDNSQKRLLVHDFRVGGEGVVLVRELKEYFTTLRLMGYFVSK